MYLRLSTLALCFLFLLGCVSSSVVESREAALNDWLVKAEKPVLVRSQTSELNCAPTLNCYTLVDKQGAIFYAKNVRVELPRRIE